MDIALFGPPGAGKGTQAKLLAAALKVPQVATGDMMRAESRSGSELGAEFDRYMKQGALVPDALVFTLIENCLSEHGRNGAVFDGYPRTVDQAQSLEKLLGRLSRRIDHAVAMEVPLAAIIDRVAGRRVCRACGQVYHLNYNPPPSNGACSQCGGREIVQREDDTEAIARKRFEEYDEKTKPVLEFYRSRGVLGQVDGVGSLAEVTARIESLVAGRSLLVG